jgi:methionine sulfoxide reductase heme-binding subunit
MTGFELPGLWSLSRATGVVLIVLLSVTLAFGMLSTVRRSPRWWPRFATTTLHVNLAVLSCVLLVVHVVVTVTDGFVDISWVDAMVPFASGYQRVWTGLGTIAALLILGAAALAASRRFLPPAVWRRSHYVTHAAWPVAVVHGLGIGTDNQHPTVVALTLACIGLVTFATVMRFTASTGHAWAGLSARVAAVALPVAVGIWLGAMGGAS